MTVVHYDGSVPPTTVGLTLHNKAQIMDIYAELKKVVCPSRLRTSSWQG